MLLSTTAARTLFKSVTTGGTASSSVSRSVLSRCCAGAGRKNLLTKHQACAAYAAVSQQQQQQYHFFSTQATETFDTTGRDAYKISKTWEGPDVCKKLGLADAHGITNITTIYRNMSYPELFEMEQKNNEGVVVDAKYGKTFSVLTGKYTGRSPHDKWVVLNPGSRSSEHIDWNHINQPTTPEVWKELYKRAVAHFNTRDTAYVFDGYCGANPASQKKVRFLHEVAWQSHFVTNMFIRPETEQEIDNFQPDFTVLNCCSQIVEDWSDLNLHSETAVVFNVEERCAVVFGTWYGGENKKGIFSLMNYWLPENGHLPMHCSANVGKKGDVSLFFGLSGTGKTTLSADPHRALIGDDEHGWDDHGVFNFEGGCYAKTIDLSEKNEPDIYRAIHTDALLENIMVNPDGTPNYSDTSITQNGRVSYPIFHIPGYHKEQMAGHPNNVIFLSCDAFGILPPVAKLSSGQAMYQFLSGYTAKVAGTERGIKEPTPSFSTCYGAAFLTLHPTVYADLLQKKLDTHGSSAFLVNSGWTGGPYGVGNRMSIKATRACVDAIMDGTIHKAPMRIDPIFGFEVPTELHDVDSKLLDPRSTWPNPNDYDQQAKELAKKFIDNFKQYEGKGSMDYTQYGPKI